MNPTSAMCRTQEALQRSRAAETSLANVRAIAEKAAAAWSREAISADKREQRRERTLICAAELIEQKRSARERAFSENPDLGYANA